MGDEQRLLEEAFFNFDTERSGFISVDEMRGLLRDGQPMSESEIDEFIKTGDPSGSGWIDYKQFSAFLMAVDNQ